jgi:hypothetical protein
MLSAKSSELRMSLEIALVDLVQKLKEPSVSALVQKIERLKSAMETGKPVEDIVPQTASPRPQADTVKPAETSSGSPPPVVSAAGSGLDTATLLQKAFLAEEVPVNPETEKLF